MKRLWMGLFLTSLLAGVAAAANVEGTLMDKMCATAKKDAKTHERSCALTPNCQKSGFGVVTADGKYLTFDEKGNAEALKALQASKKTDDLKVSVTGDVTGDSIKVTTLKLQ